jgi:uncharacterized protein YjiS (DUF1127 family)
MNANVPVLPLAGATALRGSFAALALVTRWLKELARARRHRREARALAGLDRRMLADIGVSPADVSDAFSSRFWEDPTEVLRARADERRGGRPSPRRQTALTPDDVPPLQPYPQPAHRSSLPML